MFDYFLKFENKEQADAVLYRLEGADPENSVEGELVANYSNIDVIGLIYKPTGEAIQSEEGEVAVMLALQGWHVNIRSEVPCPELARFSIQPNNPCRVWA